MLLFLAIPGIALAHEPQVGLSFGIDTRPNERFWQRLFISADGNVGLGANTRLDTKHGPKVGLAAEVRVYLSGRPSLGLGGQAGFRRAPSCGGLASGVHVEAGGVLESKGSGVRFGVQGYGAFHQARATLTIGSGVWGSLAIGHHFDPSFALCEYGVVARG